MRALGEGVSMYNVSLVLRMEEQAVEVQAILNLSRTELSYQIERRTTVYTAVHATYPSYQERLINLLCTTNRK